MLFPHPNQRTLPVRDQSIPYSDAVKLLSRVRLFATPWTIAYQAPPFMGFSKQEYCSGLPFPSPGDRPNPEIEPWSPALQADALLSEPPGKHPIPLSNSVCSMYAGRMDPIFRVLLLSQCLTVPLDANSRMLILPAYVRAVILGLE